jgi:hypothetical protein
VPVEWVSQLQRTAGNQAVARMLVQRKHDDLPVDEKADPGFIAKVKRYNATPRLADIADPILLAKQQDGDEYNLTNLMEQADGLPASEYVATVRALMERHGEEIHKARMGADRAGREAGAKVEHPTGPLTFRAPFPSTGLRLPPKKGARPFDGVGTLQVTIAGKDYSLFAGQDFLNPRQSDSYKTSSAEIKPGSIPVFVQEKEEGAIAVLGDFHHRFVWNAYHGVPITAELKPGWTLPKAWSEITYKLHPKNEYEFQAGSQVTRDLVLALASDLPRFLDLEADAPEEVIAKHVRIAMTNSDAHVDPDELPPLREHLRRVRSTGYEEFVRRQQSASTNRAHADAMAKILLESFPSGYLPRVVLAPTPSSGYFDSVHNVIVLDPVKNKDADALLDTLAYETGNALRRDDFLENAKFVAQIEFQVTDGYVQMLMEATHSGGINSLVGALGIDPALTNDLADATKSLAAKKLLFADGKEAMPPMATLGEQYKRTALTAYLQQDWAPDQRERFFASTEHAEGMEATGATYEAGKGAAAFVDTSLSGVARPSLRPVALAMSDAYPKATRQHFDALAPRQFGEFLITGHVERWDADARPDTRVDGLMVAVIRDLGEVYPNRSAWEPRLKDLTFADFGEFLLYGKVRSWEDRELMLRT